MLHLATVLLVASVFVPLLVSSSPWNDPTSNQYHIQTDEGPERYFRYQTNNGQYRKEKRLQDGTVIGTYAWIDDNGYLRQRDYIADNQGYRIVKNKNIYVGKNVDVGKAVKATKKLPNTSGTSVKLNILPHLPNTGYISITPKPIYTITGVSPSVELSLNSIPSSTPASIVPETSSFLSSSVLDSNDAGREYLPPKGISNSPIDYLPSTTSSPITSTYVPPENKFSVFVTSQTYSPPATAYLPSRETPAIYVPSRNPTNVLYPSLSSPNTHEQFSTTTISPISSVSYLPPISSSTYLPPSPSSSTQKPYTSPIHNPSPFDISGSRQIASTPRPFTQSPSSIYPPSRSATFSSRFVPQVTPSPFDNPSSTSDYLDVTSRPGAYTSQSQGYNSNSIEYSRNAGYEDYGENFVNPYIHQNGPTYPIDTKGRSFNPTYNNIGNGYDPQYPYYDGISVTNDGFRYYIPRAYHEEQKTAYDQKSGSFGYIDPFGIRRVIYYNAGPDGFKHRKNNRYVGFNATPYDPRPY